MATVRDTLTVRSGDVRLAVYLSGPRNAPPVILVHGYPDSARVWERVREHLDKRFRVIAYDVRGAGASDAPKRRADYKLSVLAQDLLAVADVTCGDRPFHLVGHDWGSIQCWEAATDPAVKGRLASYTSISGRASTMCFARRSICGRRSNRGTSRSSICRSYPSSCGGWAARSCGRCGCAEPSASSPMPIRINCATA
ncbi:hypothetical protein BMMON2_03190 [Burkholderia mallei]